MGKELKTNPFKVARPKYKVGFFLSIYFISLELAIALIIGGIAIAMIAIINSHVIDDLISAGIDDMNNKVSFAVKENIDNIFVENNQPETREKLFNFLINYTDSISVLGIKIPLTIELLDKMMPADQFESVYHNLQSIANGNTDYFTISISPEVIKTEVLNEIPMWKSFIEPNQLKIQIIIYVAWGVLLLNIILLAVSALTLNAYMMIPTTIITVLSLNLFAIIGVILMDTSRKMKVIQVE